jgi:RNA polymerase sigma factor (sigma-70 family)
MLRQLRKLAGAADPVEPTDRELLRRYFAERDEAAFAALVRRHEALVWGVCRRALRHHQDAEDAFQAVFLILARKAGAVGWHACVAPWLYAVARRVACKARTVAARGTEAPQTESPAADPLEQMTARELLTALGEEVAALPEKYRGPIVLCWLEGRTQPEAARLLGSSLNTVRRRLDAGRKLLHTRLTRRGLALPALLGMIELTRGSAEAAPATALAAALGKVPASAHALRLAQTLALSTAGRVKAVLALLLAAGVTLAGFGLAAPPTAQPPRPAPPKEEGSAHAADKEPALKDLHGDPLPPGAVARIGTVRFRHPGGVGSLAFSPDGKTIASAGDGAILWDAETGRKLRAVEGSRSVAFVARGKRIVVGQAGPRYLLYDVASGERLRTFETADKGADRHPLFAVSRDERLLAGIDAGGDVRVWEIETGKEAGRIPGDGEQPLSLAFLPDGKTLVTGATRKRLLTFWDVKTGEDIGTLNDKDPLAEMMRLPPIYVAVSPDGGQVATVGHSPQSLALWDRGSGRSLWREGWEEQRVRSSARPVFSPDGGKLAAIGFGGAVQLWDVSTGKPAEKGPRVWVDEVSCSFTFSADGGKLAVGTGRGEIGMWDVRTGTSLTSEEREVSWSSHLAVSPDGRLAAIGEPGVSVCLCEIATGRPLRRLIGPGDGARLSDVAFSPDARKVLTLFGGMFVSHLQLWDAASGEAVRAFRPREDIALYFQRAAFSPDGKTVLAWGEANRETGRVAFFSAATGASLRHVDCEADRTWQWAPHPDGRTVALGGSLWDLEKGSKVRALGENAAQVFSADGRVLVTAGKRLRVWETATGGERLSLGAWETPPPAPALSPNGRLLAVGGAADGAVRLWDLASGKELAPLRGHAATVRALAFTPDGDRLLSASTDRTVLVWDVRRLLRPLPGAARSDNELSELWEALAGDDAAAAARAQWRLAAVPEQTLSLVRLRLKRAAPEGAATGKLIEQLDADEFEARERAQAELARRGDAIRPELEKALKAARPEAKRRIEHLLERFAQAPLSADDLRAVRTVEVLERIGEPARDLLKELAKAAPTPRWAGEANRALGNRPPAR